MTRRKTKEIRNMTTMTPEQERQFEEDFRRNLDEHQGPSQDVQAAAAKKIFCQNWGVARQALLAISNLVGSFIVKAAVKTLVAAGDALKRQVCL
jgi:hypothetical protein